MNEWWSMSKSYFFCKDIIIQTDLYWQFSMAQFSVVVCDQETKFKWSSSLKRLKTVGT